MAKYHVVSPDGKQFEVNAPDGVTETDVIAYVQTQSQLTEENTLYDNQSHLFMAILFFAFILAGFLLKKFAPKKLTNLRLVLDMVAKWIVKNFLKMLVLTIVLFIIWMFRYEVFSTHPPRCLDRWYGEIVPC